MEVSWSQAMVIMELPVGANKEKKTTALENLSQMMDRAHAVRAPGPAALDITWVGAGAADCFFHFGDSSNVQQELMEQSRRGRSRYRRRKSVRSCSRRGWSRRSKSMSSRSSLTVQVFTVGTWQLVL